MALVQALTGSGGPRAPQLSGPSLKGAEQEQEQGEQQQEKDEEADERETESCTDLHSPPPILLAAHELALLENIGGSQPPAECEEWCVLSVDSCRLVSECFCIRSTQKHFCLSVFLWALRGRARKGECATNPGFMLQDCAAACKAVAPSASPAASSQQQEKEPFGGKLKFGGKLMVATDDALVPTP